MYTNETLDICEVLRDRKSEITGNSYVTYIQYSKSFACHFVQS